MKTVVYTLFLSRSAAWCGGITRQKESLSRKAILACTLGSLALIPTAVLADTKGPAKPDPQTQNQTEEKRKTLMADATRRADEFIERHVLSHYGATRLPSGEHQLKIPYQTDQDLDNLIDDLLFEISGQAQLRDCFSETEARLEGTDRSW